MDIVLGLTLLATTFLVLAYPLYQTRRRPSPSRGGPLSELLAQRDGLYATLRDLDLDYELGKLDGKDYSTRREKYLVDASLVLQQLDVASGTTRADSIESDEIEREVAALRRLRAERGGPRPCPNCGRVHNEGDRFCGRCGHTLS